MPEGLQAAILAVRRAKHVFTTEFRVVGPDGARTTNSRPLIIIENHKIVGVIDPSEQTSGKSGRRAGGLSVAKCIVVDEDTPMIATLREMNATEVDYAVVTTKQKNARKRNKISNTNIPLSDNTAIAGIITPRRMAELLRENAEIL